MVELHYLDSMLGGAWDSSLFDPLAELNAEILEACAGAPARPTASSTEASLHWQWRALGELARARLARCPYLLVDAGFTDADRWVNLPRAGVHEAVPIRVSADRRAPLATPLLRRILVFAWHLARANGLGARIALGMSPSCAEIVAGFRFADLEALAEQRPLWIRPRWHDRPEVWKAWMIAAAEESPRGLERMQLWGLQTLAAALSVAET